jgi:uncharacterized protein (DUF2062 family)
MSPEALIVGGLVQLVVVAFVFYFVIRGAVAEGILRAEDKREKRRSAREAWHRLEAEREAARAERMSRHRGTAD